MVKNWYPNEYWDELLKEKERELILDLQDVNYDVHKKKVDFYNTNHHVFSDLYKDVFHKTLMRANSKKVFTELIDPIDQCSTEEGAGQEKKKL